MNEQLEQQQTDTKQLGCFAKSIVELLDSFKDSCRIDHMLSIMERLISDIKNEYVSSYEEKKEESAPVQAATYDELLLKENFATVKFDNIGRHIWNSAAQDGKQLRAKIKDMIEWYNVPSDVAIEQGAVNRNQILEKLQELLA